MVHAQAFAAGLWARLGVMSVTRPRTTLVRVKGRQRFAVIEDPADFRRVQATDGPFAPDASGVLRTFTPVALLVIVTGASRADEMSLSFCVP